MSSYKEKITYEYKEGMLVSAHMPNLNVYNYIYFSDGQDDVADYLSNYVQELQKSLGCDVSLN